MSLEACASNLTSVALTVLELFDRSVRISLSQLSWVGVNMASISHVTVTANQQLGPGWPNSS